MIFQYKYYCVMLFFLSAPLAAMESHWQQRVNTAILNVQDLERKAQITLLTTPQKSKNLIQQQLEAIQNTAILITYMQEDFISQKKVSDENDLDLVDILVINSTHDFQQAIKRIDHLQKNN